MWLNLLLSHRLIPCTRSLIEWRGRREAVALAMFADSSRSETRRWRSYCPLNRHGSPQFSTRSLSFAPLPADACPFKVMPGTVVRYC